MSLLTTGRLGLSLSRLGLFALAATALMFEGAVTTEQAQEISAPLIFSGSVATAQAQSADASAQLGFSGALVTAQVQRADAAQAAQARLSEATVFTTTLERSVLISLQDSAVYFAQDDVFVISEVFETSVLVAPTQEEVLTMTPEQVVMKC